jgi:NAD(P)-dependent dehydrogenase (short-subunit alcohol dehydrogenase family)
MRVFVAGASGVIGRALVPRLVKAGHEVIGMSNDQSTGGLVRTLGAAPVVVDVFDRTGLTTAVRREKPDAVIAASRTRRHVARWGGGRFIRAGATHSGTTSRRPPTSSDRVLDRPLGTPDRGRARARKNLTG